ncbi:MAG: hypothetical protein HMLIMOIP_002578 [Candidatus Nitrosomirales archaeon]|jgi:hypothetical protein
MIKGRVRMGTRELIVLGLDAESIRRLKDNKPILFKGEEIGIPNINFTILVGDTLDDIKEDLRCLGIKVPE